MKRLILASGLTLVLGALSPAAPTRPPEASRAAPRTPAPVPVGMSASTYQLNWYSINGGGAIDASSPSYKMGLSVGQSVAGEASSASYKVGIGFWYGADDCSCPYQGDMDTSGFIDVQDVLAVIRVAFVNGTDVQDLQCPKTRADVNNSGVVDVNDVLYIIKTAFTNGPAPVDPCGP